VADHLVAGLHCADASDLAAAFVLGALESAEMDAVRRHLAGCPEPHAEFAELGSVVPALFEAVDIVEPRANLGARIHDAAAAQARATHGRPEPSRLVESTRWGDGRRPVWMALGLAAALALVALGAWNLQLRDQIEGLTTYRNGVAAVLEEAAQPGAQLAVLANPGTSGPSGLAVVSNRGANVSLVMRDLAPTSGAEVYEAWLIAGENAPVPIGSFTVSASGVATFTASAPPPSDLPSLTVALTREPGPGATTPTLPIVALGTAS
jgi:anti-sigma-K factor RskA